MIHYIMQIVGFQLFFLLVYDLFLKKETFFNYNRIYLLITSVISFALPFIKIKAIQKAIPQDYLITLPEIIINSKNDLSIDTILLDTIIISSNTVSYIEWLFYFGLSISILLFVYKLIKIYKIIHKSPKIKKEGFRIVNIIKSKVAFSFLNYIFIGEKIESQEALQIFEHEKIHVQQKHTLDLLYFEILKILFWFNPLIYVYQKRIAELHEFIADAKAVKHQNKNHYYQNLLSQIFDTNKVSFINTFFKQSLIKKRIVMLSKQKSKQILKLKYALLIPVVFSMLLYTSCEKETVVKQDTAGILEQVEQLKAQIANQEFVTDEEKKQIMSLSFEVYKKSNNTSIKENKGYLNAEEVPFAVIDQVPIFPSCESGSNAEQKKCMSQKIGSFILENFNKKIADNSKLSGRIKIYVGFKINKQGDIIDVRARAPHLDLATEAERVVKLLPKMLPGKHQGKAVTVPYSLPIVFQINE